MNKTILISFITLCLLSIPFLTEHKISVKASPTMIYVPTQYPTIQDAINHASSGDVIFVRIGTYYENVIVNKTVSLIGEDRDSTIIDGKGIGSVISIKASNVTIKGFTIRESGDQSLFDCGIYVERSNGNYISNNKITDNYEGILFFFSTSNIISGNIFLDNYDGISMYFSSNNKVLTNTMLNNSYGVYLYSSNNNIISHNTVSSSVFDGITFDSSTNNIISSNMITKNVHGISLYTSCNNNMILGNTISFNTFHGLYFAFDSSNNIICHNNLNNVYQVLSDAPNWWDNGLEGNYWSDHKGQDLNEDGISETPYIIDTENQDNHPLMGIFSDFSINLQKETYNLITICNSTISDFRVEIGLETGNRIIRFNVTGPETTAGFCRVTIPTGLMNYPYIVLVDIEETIPTILDFSNETHAFLYFTYSHSSRTVTIISSKTLRLYNEVLAKYNMLNATYYGLLGNYTLLQNNYQAFLLDYSYLLGNFTMLQNNYQAFLLDYSYLLGNFTMLQNNYQKLNSTYQEHLSDYSNNIQNVRNLMYIFAAATAIFIATTIYLSKGIHSSKSTLFEERNNIK